MEVIIFLLILAGIVLAIKCLGFLFKASIFVLSLPLQIILGVFLALGLCLILPIGVFLSLLLSPLLILGALFPIILILAGIYLIGRGASNPDS